MRRFFMAVAFVAAASASCSAGRANRPEGLGAPASDLPPLKCGVLEILSDGARLFTLPDQSGILHAVLCVKSGADCEPASVEGISPVVLEALVRGGTVSYPGGVDELSRKRGFQVSYRMRGEWFEIEVETLKGDEKEVLNFFRELLGKALFTEESIERAKERLARSAHHVTPVEKTEKALFELLLGFDSYRSKHVNPTTVGKITREQVISYYRRYFVPGGCLVALNSDTAAASSLARKIFLGSPSPNDPPCPPAGKGAEESTLLVLQKGGAEDAFLGIGKVIEVREGKDPLTERPLLDIIGVSLFNDSPDSRINRELRIKRGIVQNIAFAVHLSARPPNGFVTLITDPKAKEVGFTCYMVGRILTDIAANPPGEEELAEAKRNLLRKICRDSADPRAYFLLNVNFILQGYPVDYINTYLRGVVSADREAVSRCAERYFSMPSHHYAIYGDGNKFIKELGVYGKVMMRGSGD